MCSFSRDPTSTLVDLIGHLHQLNAYHSHARNYMFGVSSADWGQIIIDMFSRKIDKLLMSNEFFIEYLPKDAADRLIEVSKVVYLENPYYFAITLITLSS